jgi:hypothetical protein
MVMVKHHLWGHVSRSTRGVLAVVGAEVLGYPQICQIGQSCLREIVP